MAKGFAVYWHECKLYLYLVAFVGVALGTILLSVDKERNAKPTVVSDIGAMILVLSLVFVVIAAWFWWKQKCRKAHWDWIGGKT